MERRRHERNKFHGAVTITWTGSAGQTSCIGNSFNSSTYGLLTEASQSIPVGTRAAVQMDGAEETVEAIVRHCRKHGAWYRIGLELAAVLPRGTQNGSASH
jgi:hypothetical protein